MAARECRGRRAAAQLLNKRGAAHLYVGLLVRTIRASGQDAAVLFGNARGFAEVRVQKTGSSGSPFCGQCF